MKDKDTPATSSRVAESPVKVALSAEIADVLTQIAEIEAARERLSQRADNLRSLLEAYETSLVATSPDTPLPEIRVELRQQKLPSRKGKPNHIGKVKLYFQQRDNPWKTAEQVADDLGIPQASVRDILGRSRKDDYEWKQSVPNEPKFFRLKAHTSS